jgi:hypothetical protein
MLQQVKILFGDNNVEEMSSGNSYGSGGYYVQEHSREGDRQYGNMKLQSIFLIVKFFVFLLHTKCTINQNVVIFKQDMLSLYNIMGRTLAAIERYFTIDSTHKLIISFSQAWPLTCLL